MKTAAVWVGQWLILWGALCGQAVSSFVNFETAPIHPVALSPNGRTLAVCNLPDGRVELFDVSGGIPVPIGRVPVGIDPVSVRFRNTNELWVANFISSSVNVVDINRQHVIATLPTGTGPADIVFAGLPERAFVSCARSNLVVVFDPLTRACLTNIVIKGQRPKAMAVTPDGLRVYVAIFESGNASTILAEDDVPVLSHASAPYGEQTPVPNDGLNLRPSLNPNIDPQFTLSDRPVSLIVKKNAASRWMDDNNGDWTEFISGTNSALDPRGFLNRPAGWDMPDRDLAIINTSTFEATYAVALMNICMDVAVNPASGMIAVVGTDAKNERRFEPNLRGTFLRVNLALVDPASLSKTIVDLNPHLDYSTSSVPRAVRDRAIGDPRGIIWNLAGTRGYVTGMGSRNLVVIDSAGNRITPEPIELGEGPTGMVLDEARARLYVLNRFSATISVLDVITLNLITNIGLFDPTPTAIKIGRRHLYDTRRNSGLGHVACASCHVDARLDRLAWDLGNPAGELTGTNNAVFHPMKGPLVTQTLQDIIGSEPLHWRGDRSDIEAFNITFTDLLGADRLLTVEEMQEFKDLLATIRFPPNQFRTLETQTDMPLPGFYGFAGAPLPNGVSGRGGEIFLDGAANVTRCTFCHTRDTGRGEPDRLVRRNNRFLKIAQLRDLADKIGMDTQGTSSQAGFGFRFDGRIDTLPRFLMSMFSFSDNQELADLTAFLLSFSPEPAGVGRQVTLTVPATNALVAAMLGLEGSRTEIIARGLKDGLKRGWLYDKPTRRFLADRNGEDISTTALVALAGGGNELTFTVVPEGSGRRLGLDRDEDGYFDRTEIDLGFDPANPLSRGSNNPPQFNPPPFDKVYYLWSILEPRPGSQLVPPIRTSHYRPFVLALRKTRRPLPPLTLSLARSPGQRHPILRWQLFRLAYALQTMAPRPWQQSAPCLCWCVRSICLARWFLAKEIGRKSGGQKYREEGIAFSTKTALKSQSGTSSQISHAMDTLSIPTPHRNASTGCLCGSEPFLVELPRSANSH